MITSIRNNIYKRQKQYTMLKLTIETQDSNRAGDIQNAYNEALNTTNIPSFMESLRQNIGNSKVGRGGSHIWVADAQTNNRLAIICL